MTKVSNTSVVTIHYTGKLEDGQVFDSTKAIEGDSVFSHDREPVEVKLGTGSVIPGFEKNLIGLEAGEVKSFKIPCDEAYGQPNKDNIQEVGLEFVPEGVKVGDSLQTNTPEGPIAVKVVEVNEKVAILDANSPLAGKDLEFDIEVVSVA